MAGLRPLMKKYWLAISLKRQVGLDRPVRRAGVVLALHPVVAQLASCVPNGAEHQFMIRSSSSTRSLPRPFLTKVKEIGSSSPQTRGSPPVAEKIGTGWMFSLGLTFWCSAWAPCQKPRPLRVKTISPLWANSWAWSAPLLATMSGWTRPSL